MEKENGANEVMYKMSEVLLKKMKKQGMISAEEYSKIRKLNMETFSPELASIYV